MSTDIRSELFEGRGLNVRAFVKVTTILALPEEVFAAWEHVLQQFKRGLEA